MQIPHPKHLIPALFSLVAGVPMLLQTQVPMVEVPANISGAARTEIRDEASNDELRRQFFKARTICMELKATTDRPFDCPTNAMDPNVQKFLKGTFPSEETHAAAPATDADSIAMDASALTHEEQHMLRRAVRLGSCSDMWKGVSEAFHLLCQRTVKEFDSPRVDNVEAAIKGQSAGRLHSASPLVDKLNLRIDALPKRVDVKRLYFRRDGTGTVPQDDGKE